MFACLHYEVLQPNIQWPFTNHYFERSKKNLRAAKRFYSSTTSKVNSNSKAVIPNIDSPINPWWVTGFSDAEGCFLISLYKDDKYKTGWRVKLCFEIHLHKKDLTLLKQIQYYLNGIGKIYNKPLAVSYHVTSVNELQIILDHFDNYTLLTKKVADFELFKQAFILIKNKEHLTDKGLEKIVAIKSSINNGLSDSLKDSFPGIVPVERCKVTTPLTFDGYWLAGFTSGEGSFMAKVFKTAKSKYGKTVQLVFQLSQHERDLELLNSIVKYFNCGHLQNKGYVKNFQKRWDTIDLQITKFKEINSIIIPFFIKYLVLGEKAKDLSDFIKVAELIKEKAHYTEDGIELITKISSGMNRGRVS